MEPEDGIERGRLLVRFERPESSEGRRRVTANTSACRKTNASGVRSVRSAVNNMATRNRRIAGSNRKKRGGTSSSGARGSDSAGFDV
jgi:hypothetical protein